MNKDLIKKKHIQKKKFNYCLRDYILWIVLIFIVIYITDLQETNHYIKHILVFISIIIFIYKMITTNKYSDNFKEFLLITGCIIYLYKHSFTKDIYENYFGYLIFINVIIMSIPSIYHKNYSLGILIILLSLTTPIDFGKYDENKFYLFNLSYIIIITTLVIFQKGMKSWSLLALLSMLPMALNHNNDPWKYRIIGILIAMLFYNDFAGLFFSKITDKEKSPFVERITDKFKTNNHLADSLFKYNNWKTNNIYYIIIIIGYIIIFNTIKYNYINSVNTVLNKAI